MISATHPSTQVQGGAREILRKNVGIPTDFQCKTIQKIKNDIFNLKI